VSRELGSITAAKEWVTARDALPMERREPFEKLASIEQKDIRDPVEPKAVITDVWAKNSSEEDEIRVEHPLGSCGFPYEDSSERCDQARNARAFAERLVEEGKCAGIDDRIDVSVPFMALQDMERPRT
jgi:hypothetical protein